MSWAIWTYALEPGWERTDECDTRDEAREIRETELIERDGWPPEFVAIRRAGDLGPKRLPPRAVIDRVRAELATGADQ